MTSEMHSLAGQPVPDSMLVNVARLRDAYAERRPDPTVTAQRVAFGTSGHRGSALERSFNEWHVLAITQAICDYRQAQGISGPLFLGMDTHALSEPARDSALEVLAGNGVEVMLACEDDSYTPTPAVSHAIVVHNRKGNAGRADGVVLTPSHNPPEEGGFKYNPPSGGPAGKSVTDWIETAANAYLGKGLNGVKRITSGAALRAGTTHRHHYRRAYVHELAEVVDMEAIRDSGVRIGVDPLGGAGVEYWAHIAEHYGLNLDVISHRIDPAFGFMTLDSDGRIRMDPSSPAVMQRLLGVKHRYDIAFACDTDHDRHGIVTPQAGIMAPNHYLSVLADYLFRHRPRWSPDAAVGKTAVTTSMIDRVAERLDRRLYEVPVGFKWFVDGLLDASVALGCEESAGASFNRIDGSPWSTDKDGITSALAGAEIMAVCGRDPASVYRQLETDLGACFTTRIDTPVTAMEKRQLARLDPRELSEDYLAGDEITEVIDHAPCNGQPLGGVKVSTADGWFAARPSGTEDLYKLYAESFRDEAHLERILRDARTMMDAALTGSTAA